MTQFDEAPTEVVRICEAHEPFAEVERACVVRDVKGRVRLVLKLGAARGKLDHAVLAQSLSTEVGSLFVPPILCTDGEHVPLEQRRLAGNLLGSATAWRPTYTDPATGEITRSPEGRWLKLERRLSKQVWLEGATAKPPWNLEAGKPALVTFYSFKGGIGRTTALVSCAWQLAKQGKSVAVVDLDLEAPGAGTLLNRAQPARGVLDFLLAFMITDERDAGGVLVAATELGADQERVSVAPAGLLGVAYLEKLARLDYAEDFPFEAGKPTPVQRALEALLSAIVAARHPDYIFIDARAGLHDLAGLALHGLAHVDVLFSRASEQGYQGLDLTLEVLARRKRQDLRCVVAHTFAPPERGSAVEQAERSELRARCYQSFKQHVYDPFFEDQEIPQEDAPDQPHTPILLHEDSSLRAFATVAGVEGSLLSEDYRDLCNRIVELCGVEEAPG